MAEYIEKQAVITALETHWNGMVLDVFEFIRNLPSADVPHWIPCSEKMPSEDGEYLVTLISYGYGSKYQVTDIASLENGEWFKWENYEWFQCCDVIAWMPLPEPYKDGE